MLSRCVSTIIAAGFAAVLAAPAQAQGTQPGTQPTPPTPADIEAKHGLARSSTAKYLAALERAGLIVTRDRKAHFPYGPNLCLGAVVAIVLVANR